MLSDGYFVNRRPINTFTITPKLPDKLERLKEIACNLSWTWNNDIIDLFRRLDADLWEETGHNPMLMLGVIKQERLEEAVNDDAFLAYMDRVWDSLASYLKGDEQSAVSSGPTPMRRGMTSASWYDKHHKQDNFSIAYFSAEFGVTECMPFYSGGLGVLAGDFLKSASDLGIPMVGIGLLYQQGYFHQYLNSDGWQQESYTENDFYNMPVKLERDKGGNPVKVKVEYPQGLVTAQIWRAQIGRVPLYLLDTNIPENGNPEDRDITDRLYGGDLDYRIRQEIMLGIGGLRALEALGIQPAIYHLNEGHAAFLILERIGRLISEHNLTFAEAFEMALATNVFTTHTSVTAAIDLFPYDLIDRYFSNYYAQLRISRDELFPLARRSSDSQEFCMPSLALRSSAFANGVSKIHGQVSRSLWKSMWPEVPEHEVPITSVTNGIHIRSWISKDMATLFDRYLGSKWEEDPLDQEVWNRIDKIPDEELWRTHERRRERLVAFARRRLRTQLERRGAPRAEIEAADEALDPSALTIVFARRFATYKRADLLVKEPERLARILSDKNRPVQIIYAGKAHPRDNEGKEILRKIVHLSRTEPFIGKIVFIEDYSMWVSRYLVQGSDLWLNTPHRLNEASGTSGMKAAVNGTINMSILDGWWDETHRTDIGWAIGDREIYQDLDYQDVVESNDIYEMLEKEVIPMFYARGKDKLPRRWIALMKASMRATCPVFNMNRMMCEYYDRFYRPCAIKSDSLSADNFARAKNLAAWKSHLRANWQHIKINRVISDTDNLEVGSELQVQTEIRLGALQPKDVSVEIYFGQVDANGEIVKGQGTEMKDVISKGDGVYVFEGAISSAVSGLHGYSVRVLPKHDDLGNPFVMNLITWA